MRLCCRCSGRELARYPVEGVEVDFCASCRGIWCEPGELEVLLGEVPDPGFLPLPFGEPDAGGPACPACRDAPLTPRRTATAEPVEILDCRRCRGVWLDGGVLARLRAELSKRRRERRPSTYALPRAPRPVAPGVELDEQVPYNVPLMNAAALPAAFLTALFVNLTPVVVLLYPVLLLVHELGHALTAWLAGFVAVPLPIGLTAVGGQRAPLVGLIVLAVLACLIWLGWREKHPVFTAVMAAFLGLQLYLTWAVSVDAAQQWITFGGLGGEIGLSAFFICTYYYRAPRRLRWDFWRYLALVPFAGVFVYQWLLWRRVRENVEWLPAGSAMTGTRDGTSDIDKLLAVHGWTTEGLISAFEGLTYFCTLVIVAHYGWFLVRAFVGSRKLGTPEITAHGPASQRDGVV